MRVLLRGKRLTLLHEPRDLWIGAYVSTNAIYVSVIPTVVLRWRRARVGATGRFARPAG